MEDQFFSTNMSLQFDLSNASPMGFSPSIANGLPLTMGDGVDAPAFMIEVQRKRADTITTLKPNFQSDDEAELDESGLVVDVPKRSRALQRLSLTPSISSSATSASASEFEYSGFDSEADISAAASPANDDSIGIFNDSSLSSLDNVPDLVHSRSNMTIRLNRNAFQCISLATADVDEQQASPDFSFNDFIEDHAQNLDLDVEASELTHANTRPLFQSLESSNSISSSASSGPLSPRTPISPLMNHGVLAQDPQAYGRSLGSDSSLGLFGPVEAGLSQMHLSGGCPTQSMHFASGFASGPVDHSSNPELLYNGYSAALAQSLPNTNGIAMYGSPCPSSPSSVRSSSPYPVNSFNGAMPSVLSSPSSNQIHIQHIPAQAPGVHMLPKGMSLYSHFAHLANPYAGLITKRSRGRRVPNKPEEMNNLGKSGKVYTCKVPGCGKCFKRSEHLKRHVRSIHTDDKPFLCPYPSCNKRFSRHDNLNQHARVHTSAAGSPMRSGEVYAMPGMHPMAHLGMSMPHPMVLTAAPQSGIPLPSCKVEQ